MPGVVGRETELGVVDGLLGDVEERLRALVVVGEPGVGKTTLWREAIDRARLRGLRVLAASPSESEARLSFAALTDLLADVGAEVLERLPAPQQHGLEVALLRAEAGRAPGRRLVGTALASALDELARRAPLVVAVDDAQWLDPASASVLEFALRRLGDRRLRLLVALRADGAWPTFVPARGDASVRTLELGELTVAALQRIVADRLGVVFPRPTLVKLAAASRGNAFHAIEIARLLDGRDPATWAAGPLPVPDDLRTLVGQRIARLPRQTRDALLRAAALARPTVGAVDETALRPAASAGLVEIGADGQVSFAHPLYAAAVYGSAGPDERAAAHRELAEIVLDDEERARHLALGARAPDTEIAAALASAARRARARGAPDAAAELSELALRVTPDDHPSAPERGLALAEDLLLAGDLQRSADVLRRLTQRADGDLRARALLVLADIEYWLSGEGAAVAIEERALAEAGDPVLRARCLVAIAMTAATHDLARARDAARAATAIFDTQPNVDLALQSLALGARVRVDLFAGEGLDRPAAERALALEAESGAPPLAVDARMPFKLAQWLRYADAFDDAHAYLEQSETAAVDEGDESSLANILLNRALLDCWSGDWVGAAEAAARSQATFVRSGVSSASNAVWQAYVAAHVGRLEDVRRAAAAAAESDEPVLRMLWRRTLGLAELAAGNAEAAAALLADALESWHVMGFVEPAVWRIHGDAAEAFVAAGELERAAAAVAELETAAARSRIPWTAAVGARSRALVLAAQGDLTGAEEQLVRARDAHDGCPMPFELARTLLAHGQVLRRLKRKRDAREALAAALAVFDSLGAVPWSSRTQEELARTAARAAAPTGLTATELRIAQLAAAGLTNDAIATEVFVTRKTVEANLSRAYRKLGIRSRAQLARALDRRDEPAIS